MKMRKPPWKGRGRLCRDCGGRAETNERCPRCWECAEQEQDDMLADLIREARETAKQFRGDAHDGRVPVGPLGYSALLDRLADTLERAVTP